MISQNRQNRPELGTFLSSAKGAQSAPANVRKEQYKASFLAERPETRDFPLVDSKHRFSDVKRAQNRQF